MTKLFSRNTKLENKSVVPMRVDVIKGPGNFVTSIGIPARQSKYICCEDVSNQYNPDRPVTVKVYLEEQREGTLLSTSAIRDNKKVVLSDSSGVITATYEKGLILGRLGLIIKLKQVAEDIISRW